MSNKPSLRLFLDQLEATGALHRVARAVSPEFEIGAILGLRDGARR
jgi:3-polyprenyl-4-hydroxybenzoate decarboxylase